MSAFVHRHRVRSFEVDHQGFVFNGRYLEITDAAMTEFFRTFGHSYPDLIAAGFDPAVVAIELGFRSPARLDDDLAVSVEPARVGTSSFQLVFTFARDGEQIAEVRTTYVNVDAQTAVSVAIPSDLRDRLTSTLREEHT